MALSATGSGASRSVVYRLIADASGVLAGTRAASASMKKLGDDVTAVSKEGEKTRKGFDQMGRTAGRVGLIAAVGLGAMVLKAANFEQAMSHVEAATRESAENMKLLRDAALDAGARTQFSATEAAEAIENLAKAGVSTADILGENGALNGALSLAAAGMLPVAQAAEDIATALTQFKLGGEEAVHVSDLLAAGAGKAQGEVSDLANALKFAGVPAANLGVSIEETTGALALFAKNGIIGEQAGTSLRGMLSSLTSPSKIAKKALDDLGISMFDQKGKFVGLAGVADQLQAHMKTLTDEERANALGKIFGNEQLQAANVLYREGGDAVRQWESNVDDAGFAAETAATKTDNLRGDLERLGGALDTFLIKGGTGSQGFLRGVTQGVTGAVDAMNKLPPSLSGALTGMLAITAVTGGGLWFGTKVIRSISDTREALANLDGAGRTAGKSLKGLALAGAGLSVLLVAAEGIKAIQRATDDALPGVNTLNKRLLALNKTGQIAALGGEFDDLGKSIARIGASDDGLFGDHPEDVFQKPFEGIFGEAGSLRNARAEVDALDQSLADLVAQGNPDAAATAISAIGRGANLGDEGMALLRENLPAYQDALDGLETTAEKAGDAHIGMGKKVRIAGQAVHFTAEQIADAQKAYDDARKQAGEIADGFLDISKNADKAKVSLGKWLGQLEKQAIALENFTANAKLAKKNGLAQGVIDQLESLGPVGALRIKQLANAGQAEIDRANAIFKRRNRARDAFQDQVQKPIEIRADVVVIDDAARRKMRALKQQFNDSLKSPTTTIKWDNHAADVGLNHLEARLARIRLLAIITPRIKHTEDRLGKGFAGGGYTGGGAKFDVAGVVHRGEFVFDQETTRRHRALFESIHRGVSNSNAQGYAQGGFVGGGGGGGITRADLEFIAANMRPLIGSANLQVKNYEDLQRLDGQVRRAGASDGWGRP